MFHSPVRVTDTLSNYNDQLATAAKILGRSKVRRRIFEAIYRGKKEIKTIKELMRFTGYSQTHILKEGGKMDGFLIEKISNGYRKRKEFSPRYRDIIELVKNKKKLEKLSTKTHPKTAVNIGRVSVSFPISAQNAHYITIDDIGSFSKVRGALAGSPVKGLRENEIKDLFKRILKEKGTFKDWGGEKSDLFSTRLILKSKRLRCAIAFKGRGTKGKLVPAKMGKNGDQITRLFDEPADLYLIVYNGQIDSSIVSQMQAFAVVKAISGQTVYYGVIDGADLSLIFAAYKQ
ncbi:MAG: hypothetical protein PHT44_01910 [Candidatus Portnoybacteria bacterium]|nr:hypothetical protein [Candidatus Portnoybacteria bacterium]MDD4982651.1 hypothetical protein [Candidatus Portnoybacteria bacterium]